ncbi:MAG: hypothetical protein JSR86_10010 [Proteobacteria bacterium]|nr:hypothetical protein [Pseudomonadota bacterium]
MDAPTPPDSRPSAPSPTTARFAARLASSTGHDLEIEGYWRPVIALAEATLKGWALNLKPRLGGPAGRVITLDSLNVVDLERANLAALRHGLAALPKGAGPAPAPVAVVPIAWSCAKSERGRRDLLRLAGQARAARQVIPVAELTGVEPGAPAASLTATIDSLKPMFGAVLIRLSSTSEDVPRLMNRGFAGASLDAAGLEISPDRPILVGVTALLKAVGPTVMLQDITTVAALTAARDARMSWASLDLTRGGWHLYQAGLEALRAEPTRGD